MMQWKIHTDTLSRGHGSPIVYACSDLVKYSNGGCSGFEPDFLFIYSAYNFSKPYLFNIIRLYCSPWRKPQGLFLGAKSVFAIPFGNAPCGARRNCKSLRSKTFWQVLYHTSRIIASACTTNYITERKRAGGFSACGAFCREISCSFSLSPGLDCERPLQKNVPMSR